MASAYYDTQWWWAEGPNSYWSTLTATDGNPNSPYLEYYFSVSSSVSRVRVVLAWLVRPQYTYDHRSDAYPLGIDLDLSVYAPGGQSMGSSTSRTNSHEVVTFTPTTTGTYRIKISRPNNRDTSGKLHLGVVVNRD